MGSLLMKYAQINVERHANTSIVLLGNPSKEN